MSLGNYLYLRIIKVSAASLLPKALPAPAAQPHVQSSDVLALLGVIYGRGLIQRRCAGTDFTKLSFIREERTCLRSSRNPHKASPITAVGGDD